MLKIDREKDSLWPKTNFFMNIIFFLNHSGHKNHQNHKKKIRLFRFSYMVQGVLKEDKLEELNIENEPEKKIPF
jgi:hypothetical protein